MESKDKANKKKNKKITTALVIFMILWALILAVMFIHINKKIVYASNEEVNAYTQISNADKIDLDGIIEKNTKQTTRIEIVKEEVELEYITKYRNNSNLLKGVTEVSQEGRNGTQQIITQKTYNEQGKLINEEQLSATVVKSSINKIVEVGTAEKIVVQTPTKTGEPQQLSMNMALNAPSGFTLEQFKTALTDSKDTNNIFGDNAQYFYYIENEYNINGIFVAAVGIHESAWGTSKIALNKKNLFGYGAYDSNPYNGAYTFESYSESIDLLARVFVKYYLNPAGTAIYGGEVASGKYYSGNTLTAVNKKYATDANWANSVYKYMQYLYGKINDK